MTKQDDSALHQLISRDEFVFSSNLSRKTEARVFDRRTMEAVYEAMTKNSIDYVDFPISSGKESVVFKAYMKGKPVAIKIFKTSTLKFSKLSEYIDGDYRFEKERKTRGSLVMLWTRKEYANLLTCKEYGISVPRPISFHKNVLIMQYLGTPKSSSPQIRKIADPGKYYDSVISNMIRLYKDAKLIHADLSEFNILIYRNRPYFIDMGQAVSRGHPSAEKFLRRDLYNISTFYARYGFRTDTDRIYKDLISNEYDSRNS